jgi:hypothetical protein
MRKPKEIKLSRDFVPAANSGPKPWDFALGSIKSRAAARAILAADADAQIKSGVEQLGKLTSTEEALIEDLPNDNVKILMIRLFRIAQERARVFGQSLPVPTPEELRHGRSVLKKSIR